MEAVKTEKPPQMIDTVDEKNLPAYGFIMIGGALVGSAIKDLRIANELAERGYPVHIFWAIDQTQVMTLHPRIKHHLFFNIGRYDGLFIKIFGHKVCLASEYLGRFFSACLPSKWRLHLYQNNLGGFDIVKWAMSGLINHTCRGVETDPRMLKRFAKVINREKIRYLIPNLSIFAPFCDEVKQYVQHTLKYLVTFQGYEVYANYAKEIGQLDNMLKIIATSARASDYPSIAVSNDYKQRIINEIGLTENELTVLPACIDLTPVMPLEEAQQLVAGRLPDYQTDLPLLTYMGRQDAEKGIDLLLYAAKMLEESGERFQLAICGTTAWGHSYRDGCRRIAQNLRLPVLEADYLSDTERTALYRASHCIVYPSIHREPFGMVPVEAMAQGTPVVVPDRGGVSELPFFNEEQAGLNFRMWDTVDLSTQLARLLNDESFYKSCSEQARSIANNYSVSEVSDRILKLISEHDTSSR